MSQAPPRPPPPRPGASPPQVPKPPNPPSPPPAAIIATGPPAAPPTAAAPAAFSSGPIGGSGSSVYASQREASPPLMQDAYGQSSMHNIGASPQDSPLPDASDAEADDNSAARPFGAQGASAGHPGHGPPGLSSVSIVPSVSLAPSVGSEARSSGAPSELLEALGQTRNLPNGRLYLPPSEEITFYREQGHTLAWDFRVNILDPLQDFVYYLPRSQMGQIEMQKDGKSKSQKRMGERVEYEGSWLTSDATDTTIRVWKCHLHSHVLKPQSVQQYYKDCLDLYEQVRRAFVEPARRARCMSRFCVIWSIAFALVAAGACALYWFEIFTLGIEEDVGDDELIVKITFVALIGIVVGIFCVLAVRQSIKSNEVIKSQISEAQEAFKHGLQSKIHAIYSSNHERLTFSVVIKDETKKKNKLWCILRISNGIPMYVNDEAVYETVKEDDDVIKQKEVEQNMQSGAPPPPKMDDKRKSKILAIEMDI